MIGRKVSSRPPRCGPPQAKQINKSKKQKNKPLLLEATTNQEAARENVFMLDWPIAKSCVKTVKHSVWVTVLNLRF